MNSRSRAVIALGLGVSLWMTGVAALAAPRVDSRPAPGGPAAFALGPVLAGSRAVWGEREGSTFRVRTSSGRVLYERTAGAVGLALEQLAASPQLVAVRLAVEECPAPGAGTVSSCNLSHPVEFAAPEGITFEVPAPTRIVVKGASKEVVGQTAADIRKIRPPEPYKGKGILYRGERVRRKAGKTGKTGTGAAK